MNPEFNQARQMKQEDGKRLISLEFNDVSISTGVCAYKHRPGNLFDVSIHSLEKSDLIKMVKSLQQIIGEIESESQQSHGG